jgi:hypothetical protein
MQLSDASPRSAAKADPTLSLYKRPFGIKNREGYDSGSIKIL